MSSTKHITQGGQVFSYMLSMFMEVNRRVGFWLVISFLVVTPFIFWIKVPFQEIRNGGTYWLMYVVKPAESVLYRIPPLWEVPYDGQILHFTSTSILKDPYMVYAGNLVWEQVQVAALWGCLVVVGLGMLVYGFLKRLGQRQAKDDQIGGRSLTEDVKAVAALLEKQGKASPIRFDKLPLLLNTEVQNILLHGTPGSGKSNSLNKLLKQLRASGDMVIVYDKNCSLIQKHYNGNIDAVLNPKDARCENWDLWLECQTSTDFVSLTKTLIAQSAKEDPFWIQSARTIFSAVAAKLRNDPKRSYNHLLRTLLSIDLKTLRKVVENTEASNLMEEKVEKTAISIRGVLTNFVIALRYLQGIERSKKPPFAIREWMKQVNEPGRHGWLWITSNARQHEALKPLISVWLAQAANCILEQEENPTRRVWFIYDELASLHQLPELPEVLSQGRKHGSCFVLGFQNKAQLDAVYGADRAKDMMDLLNTRFFFRSPDADVASWVKEQLGQRRAKVFNEQYSYGKDPVRDGVSFGKQEDDLYLVNYSDIQSLPDLSCYVTLPGPYPVVKMAMRYEKMKPIAADFLPREVNDSLDPEIEAEIAQREQEMLNLDQMDTLLFKQSSESATQTEGNTETNTRPTVPALVSPKQVSSQDAGAKETQSAPPTPKSSTHLTRSTDVATKKITATAANEGASMPTASEGGGREKEIDGLLVDTTTGEILSPHVMPDAYYESLYDQHRAMEEEEKNILAHREDEQPERVEETDDKELYW